MRLASLLLSSLIFAIGIQAPVIAQDTPDTGAVKPDIKPDAGENELRKTLWKQVQNAWRDEDFKTLEELGQDYIDHPGKTSSGKSTINIFMTILDGAMRIDWPAEWRIEGQKDCDCASADPEHYAEGDQRWAVIDDKLKAWAERYPHSMILPLARIRYSINRAWFYRGSDLAAEVNSKAWPLFQRYVKEADKTLRASAPVRYTNPAWYNSAAEVAAVADWPKEKRQNLYADMVEHATSYVPAYVTAAQFLQPQWGGDYAAIDDLIRRAQKHLPEKDGLEFYARVYWGYLSIRYTHVAPAKLAAADWNMIKQGFDVITERYPQRTNVEGAARMACRYRDRPYFDAMARRLGIYEWYLSYPIESLNCSRTGFMPDSLPDPMLPR